MLVLLLIVVVVEAVAAAVVVVAVLLLNVVVVIVVEVALQLSQQPTATIKSTLTVNNTRGINYGNNKTTTATDKRNCKSNRST